MVYFGGPWKNLHLEGVLRGPRLFLYCLGRKGAGKTVKPLSLQKIEEKKLYYLKQKARKQGRIINKVCDAL